MNAFQIRPIEKKDNQAVANIIRTVMTEFSCVGEGYSINDMEVDQMFESYDNERSQFYVIENEKNKQILGCGGIAPLKGADHSICELRKMYFLSELRGHGMGQRLLNICLGQAKELGFTMCYLETVSQMEAANGLYLKNEFLKLNAPLGETGHCSCDLQYKKELISLNPFKELLA